MPRQGMLYSSALAAMLALYPATAAAQETDAGEQGAKRLDTVTVTSQKREENLQDVPLSVSAISGDKLNEQLISAVADLSQISPSVTYSQSNNSLNSSIRIRGIGTSVFSAAVEPSVSTVVDGVVMSRQGQAFIDLIDVQRVEILRGPQSTLFGKNSSAGVISITTKDASDEFEASGEVLFAEQDESQYKGTISGPLFGGARARLTGWKKDVGGHIDNVYDDRKLNGSESWGLRGKLQFDASDKLDFTLIGDYSEADNQCCIWQARIINDPFLLNALQPVVPSETNDLVNIDADVQNLSEQWGLSAEANYDLGGATLTSITAYREWDIFNTADIDATPSQGDSNYLFGGLLGIDINDNDNHLEQFSQEVRLASDGEGPFNYVLGAYYSTLDYDTHFERRICFINYGTGNCPASFPVPFPPFVFPGARSGYTDSAVSNENLAIFGQADWALTDHLTAIVGLRALRDETSLYVSSPYEPLFPGDAINPVVAPAGTVDGVDNPNRLREGDVSDDAVTYKVALQYAFNEDVNIYGGYTRGYKGPTVDVASDATVRDINPETSDSFELGLRSVLLDGRLTFNATVFDVEYKDFQGQQFDALAGVLRLTNAGQTSTKGVELDSSWLVTDNLYLGLAGAYTDAKFDDYQNGQCYVGDPAPSCAVTGFKDYSGGQLSNAPEWKFNVNGRYDIDLSNMPFNMYLAAAYQWQDDIQYSLDQNPDTIQDAYGILDGSVGFVSESGRYKLTIFGKNLLDQDYAAFIFQDPTRGAPTVNIDHFLPKNHERYFGFTLRADF